MLNFEQFWKCTPEVYPPMEQSARAFASIRDTRNVQEKIKDIFVFRLGCRT